ncbi:chymotrypsin-elastase inhibitor ixodidin-like, partial [Limulus polyphemus]|uniref:Chymotrypsin-elastase inhibitor ixodidin-like n=1 Tax=Limulus polyphemus TaxID=6850 RepID=A0ABM1SFS1_LIMPO
TTCNSKPTFCIALCVPGCFCNIGLVRGPYRKCINPEECPGTNPQCPDGEHFSECGTACEETCDEPPDACIDLCVKGCFCNSGLVRGPNKICIKRDDCPGNSHELFYC